MGYSHQAQAMTGLSKNSPHPPKAAVLVLALALIPLIAIGEYVTGFEVEMSVLYLLPICLVSWTIGRSSGILISVFAVVVWLSNQDLTSHILPHSILFFPHSWFHIWKAVILFATWVAFVFVLDRLKIALARADERFATVLEGLDEAVYVVDEEGGKILYVNQRCRNAFGAGEPLSSSQQIDAQLQPVRLHEEAGAEFTDRARKRWYRIQTRALHWVDGRTVLLKVASDITEQRQSEELARQQQEKLQLSSHLVTVGEIASTLAHEINQPLAAIANYNNGCVRRLRAGNWDPQELLAAMEKAGAQAERAGRIIQRVRQLVGKRKAEPVACDINTVIADAVNLIEINAEKNNVRLSVDLAPDLPAVRADEVMFEQAILNITRNGIDSMQQVPLEERELTIRSRLDQGAGMIDVEIADTGCGIPEEMVGKPFEPFFTTKPEGMGLGLSICRSIMEFHDGRLWATRNPGRGSTFHLSLPLQQT